MDANENLNIERLVIHSLNHFVEKGQALGETGVWLSTYALGDTRVYMINGRTWVYNELFNRHLVPSTAATAQVGIFKKQDTLRHGDFKKASVWHCARARTRTLFIRRELESKSGNVTLF